MKIAFLSHLDLNLYLFRLPIMKELVKNGYKVYAICPKGDVFDKFSSHGIQAVDYEIDRGSLNILKEIKTIKNIKKTIKTIDPDILHTFMHKPNIYGNLTGHKKRVNTITGLGSFFIHNDMKSKIIRKIIETLYKTTAKTTKKVIFQNSDDMKLFLDKKIIDKNKVILIKSSGIDTNEWKSTINHQPSTINHQPIILMIARVIRDKGVKEFINAAELLKDKAEFWYVGDKDTGNKNAFEPEWKNVQFLGFRSDIKELISKSDIVVLPSYREGVPRTLIEAASMSKPIVTTNAPGCREIVDDKINGFLVPIKNSIELAKNIEVLIEDKNLREKFGKNSRIKAIKEFDIKIIVDKYMKMYKEIIDN